MSSYKSYTAYRKAWDLAGEVTPTIPLNIDIELSATCDLRCPFCFVTNPKFQEVKSKIKNKFMPMEMIGDIILQAAEIGIPALKFNWRGEPTLHPYFSDIIFIARHYLKKPFWDLIVNTNGNYDHKKTFKGIMNCTKVIFSVDSLQDKTYKKMRINGDLEKLKSNIADTLGAGHSGIILQRVITKDNQDENFRDDVISIFGDIMVEVTEHYAFNRSSVYSGKYLTHPKIITESGRTYCGYPSQRLVIDADGYYHVCCVDLNNGLILGNFKLNTIKEIWGSMRLANIRSNLKQSNYKNLPTCRQCQSYMSYNHPYRSNIIA